MISSLDFLSGASCTVIPSAISITLSITGCGYLHKPHNYCITNTITNAFLPTYKNDPQNDNYRQPRNTWFAQTMERESSLSKLWLGVPGWMVGKVSILRRINSLLECHCLFVSQYPFKDSTQFSRWGFWLRNSETISPPPLPAAITKTMQNNPNSGILKLIWLTYRWECVPPVSITIV